MKELVESYRTEHMEYHCYQEPTAQGYVMSLEDSTGTPLRSITLPPRNILTHHTNTAWMSWLCYDDGTHPPILNPKEILTYFLESNVLGVIQAATSEEDEATLNQTYLDFSKESEAKSFDVYGTMVPGVESEFSGAYNGGFKTHEAYTSWLATKPSSLETVFSPEDFVAVLEALQETDGCPVLVPKTKREKTKLIKTLTPIFSLDTLYLLSCLESGCLMTTSLSQTQQRFLYHFLIGLPFEYTLAYVINQQAAA